MTTESPAPTAAYAHWADRTVRHLGDPSLGTGVVVDPTVLDWHRRPRGENGRPVVDPDAVVVSWSGYRRWEQVRDLVDSSTALTGRDADVPAATLLGVECEILAPVGRGMRRGLSGRATHVVLVGPEATATGWARTAVTEERPAVRLRRLGGAVNAYPDQREPGAGPMFGGAFVWGGAGFREILGAVGWDGPIPLHDRFEG